MPKTNDLRLAALTLVMIFVPGGFASAVDYQDAVVKVDKTENRHFARAAGLSLNDWVKDIVQKQYVRLALEIIIDGKDEDAVLISIEAAERRSPARCAPGVFGSLIQESETEYFFQVRPSGGKQVRLSLFPGSRTDFPLNRVDCLAGPTEKTAILKISGHYIVHRQEQPDAIEIELRAMPAPDR